MQSEILLLFELQSLFEDKQMRFYTLETKSFVLFGPKRLLGALSNFSFLYIQLLSEISHPTARSCNYVFLFLDILKWCKTTAWADASLYGYTIQHWNEELFCSISIWHCYNQFWSASVPDSSFRHFEHYPVRYPLDIMFKCHSATNIFY
jgi:hypothetical protein